ncbi:helix-turn-helix transcriptional regulator [Pseudomonas sp. OV546]|uniref:helix-turn-helix domain-containing protein n=1 Tax=Pseudomonas sp. OV546 TaxID=1881063 RepID=UPI0008DFA6DC|nr:helix-turn-helix transcriptional regulator [Pseudomonas sp. OV546]SFV12679.1 Helix-turn-helix [Pseudomonas sp. OV546]
MSKKPLPQEKKDECLRLKALFNRKKNELGLTQEKLAHALEINQSSVSHYLNGVNPLNPSIAASFANILKVDVREFSERLAKEISQMASSIDQRHTGSGTAISLDGEDSSKSDRDFTGAGKRARALALAASPRSRSALERIAEAADSGLLSEQDVLLLEAIATRLSIRIPTKTESPHQRLRKKLTPNDPVPE